MNKLCYGYNDSPVYIKDILNSIVEIFQSNLDNKLEAIYLHGSLALGCFNPNISDIDLLVIVNCQLSIETKKQIIKEIIHLSDSSKIPKKGLEFSVVQLKFLHDFVHPTPFELHYSPSWREKYRTNTFDYDQHKEDRDLAAHFTITYHRGLCLFGKAIINVIPEIPEADYIDSLIYDVEDYTEVILKDPVYVILNLCRVLYFLREKKVASKIEGGLWAINQYPDTNISLISAALDLYKGVLSEYNFNTEQLQQFNQFMLKEVGKLLKKQGIFI
ncbi:MAG: DUF4111 domain-containing protein [Candidatus Heimdallarchaeota archaeon]|nr:DUF4111 domain-containing protein [Candidatus Heimdallarchaeota archaeon]MBY8994331.1 DUF4111 domain-containing protein [Candidatus Heimdallarchaeota archaeon]